MPTGILINSGAVLAGSLIGATLRSRLPKRLAVSLPNTFGFAAMTIGISLIVQLENLSAVILALICGTAIGELLRIEDGLNDGLRYLEERIPGNRSREQMDHMVNMIVLFCFSGTGVFGSMISGINGDHSILIAKSILDFFTAIIFGSTVGYMLALVAIPQLLFCLLLFVGSSFIYPLLTQAMMNDFKACGGIITLAVGLKIAGIKKTQVLNMLPGLLLVFIFSWMWTSFL